jgi:GNAT superfamily N-acetyltransferase
VRTIAIRPARVADLGVLCELYRQLNPGDPPWPSEAAALDALASVPRHAGTTILVCEVEGMSAPARSSVASISRDRDAHLTLIENAVTHRDQRRQGYGRRVVQRAIEAARQQGCYRVSLMTGSRRQETLRAFMRRQECKGGRRRHSRHGLSRTPSALALAPTILFCLRAGSREPSWHRLANDQAPCCRCRIAPAG